MQRKMEAIHRNMKSKCLVNNFLIATQTQWSTEENFNRFSCIPPGLPYLVYIIIYLVMVTLILHLNSFSAVVVGGVGS